MTHRTDFQGRSIDLRKIRRKARVSDHAVLRYLERVMGLPVEKIRAQLLSDAVLQAMALNAPSVRAADHQIVFHQFDQFCVCTVLTSSMRVRRPRRRKPRWQALQAKIGEAP